MADLPDVAATAVAPAEALASIWSDLGLDDQALSRVILTGAEPILPTSFAVGTAAQVTIAAAALAATEIGRRRGQLARAVSVDLADAVRECTAHFSVNGVTPPAWDPISGLYRCGRSSDPDRAAGWIRIHANFPHHRDGAIHLLGLGGRSDLGRADVERALANWRAEDVEDAADELGLPMAALRTSAQWQAHPQARLLQGQPLVAIEQIGDAPPRGWPVSSAAVPSVAPLAGLRVLDLSRVLAGPIACRTLATLGAEVLTVHSPGLPNIAAWPDTSRGKRSAEIDIAHEPGRLRALVRDADVFFAAARPGAIEAAGFGAPALHRLSPGIVAVSLDAWGDRGPWGSRRGFDSLVRPRRASMTTRESPALAIGRSRCRFRSSTMPRASWLPSAPRSPCCASAGLAAVGGFTSRSRAPPPGCAASGAGRSASAARLLRPFRMPHWRRPWSTFPAISVPCGASPMRRASRRPGRPA